MVEKLVIKKGRTCRTFPVFQYDFLLYQTSAKNHSIFWKRIIEKVFVVTTQSSEFYMLASVLYTQQKHYDINKAHVARKAVETERY